MDKMKSTKTMIKKTAGTYGTELVTNQVEDGWQEISSKPLHTINIGNQDFAIERFENHIDEYQQDVDPYYQDQNYYGDWKDYKYDDYEQQYQYDQQYNHGEQYQYGQYQQSNNYTNNYD